ncbi:MAG: slipin family protein [Ignavibacteria bacterium]|nr:slipin family protein [Ignavibacteria bacterium]
MQPFAVLVIAAIAFLVIILGNAIRILRDYERAVIFRLGRKSKAVFNPGGGGNGPGLIILVPMIDRMIKVSLRTVVMDVPPQDVITKDNVSIKVNAVVYFRVMDPEKAILDVENYLFATSQLSQTTLRSVLGQSELDELLSEREKINLKLQQIMDNHTESWGIKVSNVEVKQIDLPQEMQRAMAKQAEAERERRSKIIAAEGEFQASQRLADAAEILSNQPSALTLRYLQTLREIATENNSTTIFPVPIDLLKPFLNVEVKKKK